jgi:hypothetical protein
MWTDKQFWRDSTWRAFRTFCQALAGLLVMQQASSAFDLPWKDIIGAAALASFISLLQSIDRERVAAHIQPQQPVPNYYDQPAVIAPATEVADTVPLDPPPVGPPNENLRGTFGFAPLHSGCGESLR